ncbi:uncharacterized protein BX664DRAFT_281696 [Halteromyces radiatus]|uniref:uncharacterized protein n=1 Tax=Halteromyces radiatus TaxID=101107 RepID=UPI0022204711|nr:uncharacterized protein BX664DRAFT_281696 [Halteromyces radiatus]KAI8086076.1 hypothetical protein BX664DRAFT_281696 [Halteromyces radiatus]
MGIRTLTKRPLEALPLRPSLFTSSLPGDATNSTSPQFTRISRPVMAHYAFVHPEPAPDPVLLSASTQAATTIDLDPASLTTPLSLNIFSGESILPDTHPWALNYAGHQFSMFAGQLGDGRAISLFETQTKQGERWELQLKGAGRTPFSRFGDGYAVLRSSIREYLASEHLAALGIPTTRALALIGSSRQVYREDSSAKQPERGAVLVRLAPSWIRFGNFELFYSRDDMNGVRQLADYCVDNVLPSESTTHPGNKYAQLFINIAKRTATMVAGWQANGFNHGVMNTDNMSILGLSLDYGPFQILDYYDPSYICNHSDEQGQYAFKRQPTVCIYNLFKLGVPLFELIGAGDKVDTLVYGKKDSNETVTDAATRQAYREAGKEYVTKIVGEDFTDWFMEALDDKMRAKLGLTRREEGTMSDVIIPLLDWATEYEVDYHRFFRSLSKYQMTAEGEDVDNERAAKHDLDVKTKNPEKQDDCQQALIPWLAIYRHRLQQEDQQQANRQLRMDAVNPRFVLRNWIAQEVIDAFDTMEETDAKAVLDACLYACSHPYQAKYDQDIIERWIETPVPTWGQDLKCSCSS